MSQTPPPSPTPLVTCVMTAFDDAQFVERAVASALDQRGLPAGAIEIVATDDGSTDGTAELLEGMGAPVRVLRQQRLGPAVGMNRGIAEARGRYVAMLDADDEWLPDRLTRQLALLDARPEVGLVYGDTEQIDAEGNVIQPSHFAAGGMVAPVGRVLGPFIERNYAGTTTIMMPTDVARAVPPAPEWAWCRDWWLATHIAATHELDCVPEPITRYRLHDSNLSGGDDGQPEKTLRLFHRDLNVRRIFLRSLDLSSVSLEQLEVAWRRHAHYVDVLVRHRGVSAAEIIPVTDTDRAEAADALSDARELLRHDPLAAGQAAMRALAADPFGGQAGQLLAEASRLATRAARHTPTVPSVAQADRLRELQARRIAVAGAMALNDRLGAFRRFETLRRMLEISGTPVSESVGLTPEDRDAASDAVAAGVRAAAGGRPADAAMALAAACALDPANEHARLALDDALATLGGRSRRRGDPGLRAALTPPPAPELDGARAFVGLAFADELVADPSLLAAWVASIDEHDDATLVIYSPGGDELTVASQIEAALAAAGIGDDDGRDFAAVIGQSTLALEAGLARGVHVLLTRRRASGSFAGVPVTAGETVGSLAQRRWSHDGLGRPISAAIKLCAKRWDDVERCGDLDVARALATELERRGHAALVQVAEEWDEHEGHACDVAVHLRGPWPYVPHPGQPSVLGRTTHAELVTPREAARYDVELDASADLAQADPSALCDELLRAIEPVILGAPVGATGRC